MRVLHLDGIDFSLHKKYFRDPALEALKSLADHNLSASVRVFGKNPLPQACTQVACEYYKCLYDAIIARPFPMQLEDFREVVRCDQEFRLQHGWPGLDQLRPTDRKPRDKTRWTEAVATRDLLRQVFSYMTFADGGWLQWNTVENCLVRKNSKIGKIKGDCNRKPWNAARFVMAVRKRNNLTVCPYCNAESIYAIPLLEMRGRVLRTDLDHFFPQWQYPYLALSPYNLIPACNRCNSKGKHSDDSLRHWPGPAANVQLPELAMAYPYRHDLHTLVKFNYKTISLNLFSGMANEAELAIKCMYEKSPWGVLAKEWVKEFFLRSVYQKIYTRELRELPVRWRMRLSTYPETIHRILSGQKYGGEAMPSLDLTSIRRILLNCSRTVDDINNERLSKVMVDLTDQLGVGFGDVNDVDKMA